MQYDQTFKRNVNDIFDSLRRFARSGRSRTFPIGRDEYIELDRFRELFGWLLKAVLTICHYKNSIWLENVHSFILK